MTTIMQMYKVEKANARKTHKAAIAAAKIAKKTMIETEKAHDKASASYRAAGRAEGKALQVWQDACAAMRLNANDRNCAKAIKTEKAYKDAAKAMAKAWGANKFAIQIMLEAGEVSKKADWYENDCYNELDCLIHLNRFA